MLWLSTRDRKLRPMSSAALWIPLLWFLILGSRPVSYWFGAGLRVETPDDYLDGSPFDRIVFLLLLAMGIVVLVRRGVNWRRIFLSNRWVFAFFLYCAVSIIWSDYPFVSFKRWIKDLGNVVMVLIILTEKDRVKATRAVLARFTYITIPLSIVLIKYYGELGRYLNSTWQTSYCGVTMEKNALGCIAFLSGIFLVWDLMEKRTSQEVKADRTDLLNRMVLLSMVCWLLVKAQSSTSLVCFVLGLCIMLAMRLPFARLQVRYLGGYALGTVFLVLLFYAVPAVREGLVAFLGKDMTLTGRTDIWTDLLRERINPLLGTGYQSFWLGPRVEHYWAKWVFHPNQAHNGYLETYINGGLIGVCLLMTMIVSTGSNLRKDLLLGSSYGTLRFSFFVTVICYNWTEAMFNRLTPIWFVLLIAALNYPRLTKAMAGNIARDSHGGFGRKLSREQSNVAIPSGAVL